MEETQRSFTHTCKYGIKATVIFERVELPENDTPYWQFKYCEYKTKNRLYTLEDWQDLKELSEEIILLNAKVNCSSTTPI